VSGFFAPLIRAGTYRTLAYLLLGLPLGIFYFTFLVTAVSVGAGLVVVWVGVPILLGSVIAWRGMGRFERTLAVSMVGAEVAAPPPVDPGLNWWQTARAVLADSYTYRSFLWLIIRFPLGIAGFVVSVVALSTSAALLATPILLVFPEEWGTLDWIGPVEGLVWLFPVVGLLVAAVGAHLVNGFGTFHALIAPPLLGPSARQEAVAQRKRAEAAEERTRLAHELHDSVGHTLTMMVVQAGAGRHVYDRDPEFARSALENIETSGRRALGELDRILGLLRDDGAAGRTPQPGLDRIPGLVEELSTTGLPVELNFEGSADDVPVEVSRSAYRIVQEALTNVLRHAGSVPAVVTVHRGAGAVEVEVVNDPPAGDPPAIAEEGGGRGLVGIRERVAVLGGSVEAGPRPGGGFRVWARLPLEAG
jgi:signal transduction histidine kinase